MEEFACRGAVTVDWFDVQPCDLAAHSRDASRRSGLIAKAGRVTPETEALAQAIRETVSAVERRKAA